MSDGLGYKDDHHESPPVLAGFLLHVTKGQYTINTS
jgi:hypothetical protein